LPLRTLLKGCDGKGLKSNLQVKPNNCEKLNSSARNLPECTETYGHGKNADTKSIH